MYMHIKYLYTLYTYVYVAPWVRVHKGRGIRFQTRLWVLGSTPKDKKIPQNGLQQTPWAYCCYTSRFGLSAAAATLFRTCAALSHDPCSENGRWLTWQYRMHARLSDRLKVHPRLTPVELQIHTGLFFFWMYTGWITLSKCCFRQGYPFGCYFTVGIILQHHVFIKDPELAQTEHCSEEMRFHGFCQTVCQHYCCRDPTTLGVSRGLLLN